MYSVPVTTKSQVLLTLKKKLSAYIVGKEENVGN